MTELVKINSGEPIAITRLVYGNAIRMAVSEGERAELVRVLEWYELKWKTQARMAQQQAQAQQQQDDAAAAVDAGQGEPRKVSAVEQFGVDSPEAKAMREARRAARAEVSGDADADEPGELPADTA